jgi:diguanylate cyclase (GGDEF)-like protein
MAALLSNGLLWGTLTAFLIHEPRTRHLEWPLVFAAVAFCAAGAMVMAIIPMLRFAFVGATLGPIMVSMLYEPSQQHLLVALMCVVFLVYVVVASKAVHKDYCEALAGRALLEERARELEVLSVTDRLTQIPNRLYFDQQLHMEWSRCVREHQSLTIMVLDLDHFKRINDNYGHLTGDQCLKLTAVAFKAQLRRATDVLARFGGEEFVVMLSNTDEQGGLVVAHRLLRCMDAINIPSGNERLSVTCSIGLCTVYPQAGSGAEHALDLADRALYLAKQRGRNQIAVSSELNEIQLSQGILKL